MATCKECLHWKVCNEYRGAFWGHKAQYSSPIINASADSCIFYKDRSRFVEPPCEVGDTVYILGKEIFCDEIDEISIEKLSDGILCFRAYCKELKISFDLKDFGTIAFLTKEEAEQALKEKEEKENG